MKRLLAVILIAALGWTAWWFIGAAALRGGLERWAAARQAEGWTADWSDLDIGGFPYRFDATLRDPALDDPRSGLSWRAPFVQIVALSYRPNHVIVIWPSEQVVGGPAGPVRVAAGMMHASAVVAPGPALALRRLRYEAETLALRPGRGAALTIEALRLGVERQTGDAHRYRTALLAEGIAAAGLPAPAALRVDADIDYDRAWDRDALSGPRPQPQRIALRRAEAEAGAMRMTATGDLALDAQGMPTGRVTLTLSDWRGMLALASQSGALPADWRDPLERALTLLAGLRGSDEVEVPLDFAGGLVRLGPVTLGAAPRLVLPW